MSLNISIVFCEGIHDAAFIARLLKYNCYKSFNKKMSNYPSPLSEIMINSLQEIDYESLNIKQLSAAYYAIPSQIVKKENNIVLLYAVGGNRQEEAIKSILNVFLDSTTEYEEGIEAIGADTENSFNFLFINDADDNLKKEVLNINKTLASYFEGWVDLDHNSLQEYGKNKFGLYIFTKEGEDSGKLEDILLEIMYEENEDIFDKASEYIALKCDDRLIKKKVKCQDGIPIGCKDDETKKFYPEKSIITIAGQLQSSGKGQVVTIEDSDYITLDKIKKSTKAKEIISFIKMDSVSEE